MGGAMRMQFQEQPRLYANTTVWIAIAGQCRFVISHTDDVGFLASYKFLSALDAPGEPIGSLWPSFEDSVSACEAAYQALSETIETAAGRGNATGAYATGSPDTETVDGSLD